ncbi:aminopeptidase [Zongyangia hominis]|uniref:M18 family aminopeptidase n=1 Tax=Zongyangia hominis TaxID=2763677 RepID=A0A926EDZ4_9FIRM|nr:aminopeptidase [Zongyangia hominis]MBC8570161.1 aminopeptidase [Zongyangia hominis]
MKEEKSAAALLQEKLTDKPKNSYDTMSEMEIDKAVSFCEGYKSFLDSAKTEREAVDAIVELLSAKGYKEFTLGTKYAPGEKVYYNNRGKALICATIGTEPMDQGVLIAASHIDSPRLDLKPRPVYEDNELALFKTHYYGGIKKYQWTAIPLALHGVVVKKDGETVKVRIGEEDGDPVFCVTDLLPHLATEQSKRTLSEGVKGEELNILIGSRPFKDDKLSEKVKLGILALLHEKYGMVEGDFLSAELTMVPAFKAKDLGLDRSMVGAYGHDDRVCAYTSLMATLDCPAPKKTSVVIFADKEETGSEGNTGLDSCFLKYFIADLAAPYGVEGRTVLQHSQCLSADVNVAFDPTFPDVVEKRNTAYLNYGVVVTKYTGARGKSSTSDASAEFMGKVRSILDNAGVAWQTGELGKVDFGGGGTVAKYIASLSVDVVDVGVPVLSMHAPFEVVAKNDVYETYRAFYAFLNQ